MNQACLRDLRITNPDDDKERIKSTNGGLLKDSYCWILDHEDFKKWQDSQSSSRLLWIRGDPGKGKTMLLCGIIEEFTRSIGVTVNISFFFCQATDVRINNATAVLRGLIYSLVENQSSLLLHVQSRYNKAGKALFNDINASNALSRIFTDILKDPTLRDTYIIIDALDECITDLPFLLDLILQESLVHPQVKWIVSSRNWPEIEERLSAQAQTSPISLELNEASVSEAVGKFIHHRVHHLARVKRYSNETRDTICRHLLAHSAGTFLWVALVCHELNRSPRWHAIAKLTEFPPGLSALYGRMVNQIHNSEDAYLCKRILATISLIYRPITLDELTSLMTLPVQFSDDYEALSDIIGICGSFLTLREGTIMFVHQSAKDYLLREALNEIFPAGIEAEHLSIFLHCMQIMFQELRRNIFDIKKPDPNPLAASRYACVYWVNHLEDSGCESENSLEYSRYVDEFLQQKYLHWLEALSILGSVSEGIAAMLKLEGLLQVSENSNHENILASH